MMQRDLFRSAPTRDLLVTAEAAGTAAFNAGKKRVPAQDAEFCAILYSGQATGAVNDMLTAWLRAWDAANIAAPVPGVYSVDPSGQKIWHDHPPAASLEDVFGPVIHAYTRSQAIEDGYLVDVSQTAREAGIKFPVALTRAVWDRYVEFDKRCVGQDEAGRLWDVLYMLRCAIRRSTGDGSRIDYQLHVAIPGSIPFEANEAAPERGSGLRKSRHRLVTLKAICGPGDNAEPVVTVSLPSED